MPWAYPAPTADQVDALAGTDGTPSASNKYATNTDARLTDARTPSITLAHAASHVAAGSDPVTLSASQVGLGNVTNTSDANKPVSTAQQTALDLKQSLSAKGVANGYAGLDAGGLVPVAQLPGLPTAWGAITGVLSAQTDLKLDTVAAPTDITTLNATTSAHGLMPKGTGSTTTFFRSDMTQAAPTAAASISQTEIDFGTTPVAEASFLITDAAVTASSKLIGTVAYVAPTGKDLDELEMDGLDLKFAPGTGQFTLYARGLDGYVADTFKINYLVG